MKIYWKINNIKKLIDLFLSIIFLIIFAYFLDVFTASIAEYKKEEKEEEIANSIIPINNDSIREDLVNDYSELMMNDIITDTLKVMKYLPYDNYGIPLIGKNISFENIKFSNDNITPIPNISIGEIRYDSLSPSIKLINSLSYSIIGNEKQYKNILFDLNQIPYQNKEELFLFKNVNSNKELYGKGFEFNYGDKIVKSVLKSSKKEIWMRVSANGDFSNGVINKSK